LREPPLLTSTVANYVLDAIGAEKLPYPTLRLYKEVVPLIDLSKSWSYKHAPLIKECTKAANKKKQEEEETDNTNE
jgi:hypothetical protein